MRSLLLFRLDFIAYLSDQGAVIILFVIVPAVGTFNDRPRGVGGRQFAASRDVLRR